MVSRFPLKHAMASRKKTHLSCKKKKKLTLASLGWTSVVERWLSEAGDRLRWDTLAQIILHLVSAAATDDLIRIGAESPGLVGLIVSLALKKHSSLRKLLSVSMGIFSLTDIPCTLVELLTGKGVQQVAHNLL